MSRNRDRSGSNQAIHLARRATPHQQRRMNDALDKLNQKLAKEIAPVTALGAALISNYGLRYFINELNESVDKHFGEGYYSILINAHTLVGATLDQMPNLVAQYGPDYLAIITNPRSGILSMVRYFAACAHSTDQLQKDPNYLFPHLETMVPLLNKYRNQCLDNYGTYQNILEYLPPLMDAQTFVYLSYTVSIFLLPPLIKKIMCDPLINRVYLNFRKRNTVFANTETALTQAQVLEITEKAESHLELLNNAATNKLRWVIDAANHKVTWMIGSLLLAFVMAVAIDEILSRKNTFVALSIWSTAITPFFIALASSILINVALPEYRDIKEYFWPMQKELASKAQYLKSILPESCIAADVQIEELSTLLNSSITIVINKNYGNVSKGTIASILSDILKQHGINVTDVDRSSLTIRGDINCLSKKIKPIRQEIETMLNRYRHAKDLAYQLACISQALNQKITNDSSKKETGSPDKTDTNEYVINYYLDVPNEYQNIVNIESISKLSGLEVKQVDKATLLITGSTPIPKDKLNELLNTIDTFNKSRIKDSISKEPISYNLDGVISPRNKGKEPIQKSDLPTSPRGSVIIDNSRIIRWENGGTYNPGNPACTIKPLERSLFLPSGVYYVKLSASPTIPYFNEFSTHYTHMAGTMYGKNGVKIREEKVLTDVGQIKASAKVKISGKNNRTKGDARLYANSERALDESGKPKGREILLDFYAFAQSTHK